MQPLSVLVEKQKRPRRPSRRGFLLAVLILTVGLGALWLYGWAFFGLPDPETYSSRLAAPSLRITDRSGRLLYEVLPLQGGRHRPVSVDEISQTLRLATISTEDASFYTNPGVDWKGILRAAWSHLLNQPDASGGSTITQQVARTLLMDETERQEHTLRRKLREAVLAWQLTRRYSKDEILALYLNQTYYGAFSYGVEAAAQTYFGKPVSELDLAESALLAGLPQAPGAYNPLVDPEAAKQRQAEVLTLMERHGLIDSGERELAARETLVYSSEPFPIEAPHFVFWVAAQLDALIPAGQVQGLTVRTTLDLDWQQHAETIARRHLSELNNPPAGKPSHNVNDAALVALDPASGEILAMLGSPDYFDPEISGALNMALAPLQPGSALKPLIYAAALDPQRPQPWTAATMILDVRSTFQTHEGLPYVPENYDRQEHGPVSVRTALASSLNIPAVKALDEVGLADTVRLAEQLGITTFADPGSFDLSLALGGGAVRLLDLTSAYAAFANGGFRVTPYSILDITAADGSILYQTKPGDRPRVLDAQVAWLVTDILSDDSARATGFGRNSALKLDRPAAAKTGTTTNFHDNWTIGYSPEVVVGVWVGNADHQEMRDVTGLTGAGPIWHSFMRTVLAGLPERPFPRPEGLVQIEVCALSGRMPTSACPYHRLEWFIRGTEPTTADELYRPVKVDALTGWLADETTPPDRLVEKVSLDLPPEAEAWAQANGVLLYRSIAHSQKDDRAGLAASHGQPLRLAQPEPNAIYRLAPDLPADSQRIPVAALGEGDYVEITLWVDGELLGRLDQAPYEAWWELRPGAHQAWAEGLLRSGQTVRSDLVIFTVR